MHSIEKAVSSAYGTMIFFKDGASSIQQFMVINKDNPVYQVTIQSFKGVYNLFCYMRHPEILKAKTIEWWQSSSYVTQVNIAKTQRLANMFFFLQILKTLTYVPVQLAPFALVNIIKKDSLGIIANLCGISGSLLMVSAELPGLTHFSSLSNLKCTERFAKLLSYALSAKALAIQVFNQVLPLVFATSLAFTGQVLGLTSILLITVSYTAWAYENKKTLIPQVKQVLKAPCNYLYSGLLK